MFRSVCSDLHQENYGGKYLLILMQNMGFIYTNSILFTYINYMFIADVSPVKVLWKNYRLRL